MKNSNVGSCNKVLTSSTCPCGVQLREHFLHPHLFYSLVHNPSHLVFKAVQVQLQQVSQSGLLLSQNHIITHSSYTVSCVM